MQNQESLDLRDYTIERSISVGGDAEIYLGLHLGTQTQRALKIVQRRPAETQDQFNARLSRLAYEKKLLEELRHNNVIRLLDAGQEGNVSFLGLELVNIKYTDLRKLLTEAAAGLDFVHSQGYVHNDVSLDNLLTREDGTVVLLDFGSASRVDEPASTFGKHKFMAPERIGGAPVDGRADQFSLAVVAFESITGKYPFLGEGQTVLNAIVKDPPLTLAAAGKIAAAHLQWVFDKAFKKHPSDRFESSSKFTDALSQGPKPN